MAVVFTQGQTLARGDLDIYLSNADGNPTNAFSISYAVYYVDPTTTAEVLIGSATRTPVNPTVGEYYASLQVPSSAAPGDYRIRWRFRETATSAEEGAVQEFGVVSSAVETEANPYSDCLTDLIRKMRFLTRDNNPDRNYRFMPPEGEGTVGCYNQVFGYIWTDEEFAEYLQSSQNELDGEGKPRGGGEKESEASPKRVQTPPHRRYICSDPGKKFGRFASRPDHANTFNLIIPQAGFPGLLSAAKLYGESRNKWIVDMQGKDREEKRLNQQYKMRSQKRWNTILADRVNQTDIQIKGRDKANVSSIARQHRRFMERARLYEFMNEEIQDSSACLFTKNVF